MPILLHIDSSPMEQTSISRRLTREFVQRWRNANPQGEVRSRDLAAITIPVIDAAWISANLTPGESRTSQQDHLLALSTELTQELLDADEYVIGVPMHNWGPSSSFKLWADHIVRFGKTILVTPAGPKGTLGNKRATFFIAAGQQYGSHAADAPSNLLEPWLRTFFGNLGIKKMQFVFVDGTARVKFGRIDETAFLAPYMEAMQSLFTNPSFL